MIGSGGMARRDRGGDRRGGARPGDAGDRGPRRDDRALACRASHAAIQFGAAKLPAFAGMTKVAPPPHNWVRQIQRFVAPPVERCELCNAAIPTGARAPRRYRRPPAALRLPELRGDRRAGTTATFACRRIANRGTRRFPHDRSRLGFAANPDRHGVHLPQHAGRAPDRLVSGAGRRDRIAAEPGGMVAPRRGQSGARPPCSRMSRRCWSTAPQGWREYYLVPIDRCYALVGTIRRQWRGLSGGQRGMGGDRRLLRAAAAGSAERRRDRPRLRRSRTCGSSGIPPRPLLMGALRVTNKTPGDPGAERHAALPDPDRADAAPLRGARARPADRVVRPQGTLGRDAAQFPVDAHRRADPRLRHRLRRSICRCRAATTSTSRRRPISTAWRRARCRCRCCSAARSSTAIPRAVADRADRLEQGSNLPPAGRRLARHDGALLSERPVGCASARTCSTACSATSAQHGHPTVERALTALLA